ncbi:hypothetical protein HRbin16_01321 [bacterium HR16]|nr:hypothetical protein HRbin16_01321 [bacterium HR16]
MEAEQGQWYFAYGSNMNTKQLSCRIGRQKVTSRVGYAPDHELVFNKLSRDGTGYANIQPKRDGIVYGVLYQLTEEELKKLDESEGVPKHYRREKIEVVLIEGGKVEADTYIAVRIQDGLRPRADYLKRIIEGAKEHGLPGDYIQKLERVDYVPCC